MNDQNIVGGDTPIYIYNSLSGEKEVLKSREPDKINIYVCGMTVYDYCHLGHARVLVVFDMVVRYLRSIGIGVKYVRNITDIDDKIIARATETNSSEKDLTEKFIRAMHEDETLLNVQPPDKEPRATNFINEIINLIDKLERTGYAYQGKDGDVYFRVRKFNGYGKLSKRSVDDLESGARVSVTEAKDDPLDFALWKTRKSGEPFWDSPWGPGRPGWHIECSAMSMSCLGESFDIHAGGMDLKFPHHENEIAQSEAATGKKLVNYWMHNGHVEIDSEKMAKSMGNFFTIREIISRDSSSRRMGEVIRFMILTSHYRSPLNFSEGALLKARASLTRLYRVLDKIDDFDIRDQPTYKSEYCRAFHSSMADDFNTVEAISILFSLAKEINRLWDNNQREEALVLGRQLSLLGGILGLLYQGPRSFLTGLDEADESGHSIDVLWIEKRVNERLAARRDGDWEEADHIREELQNLGVVLEDKSDGTTLWRID
jgi:cysteinyl-tRNA synthetase